MNTLRARHVLSIVSASAVVLHRYTLEQYPYPTR